MASSLFRRHLALSLFTLLGLSAAFRGGDLFASADSQLAAATPGALGTKPIPARENQVLFIESNVSDYRTLLADLPAGTHSFVFSAKADGLQQIAEYLQRHPGVDAIHLVSHGDEGQVQLGKTLLESASLDRYKKDLVSIGSAMKPGGDFLIYDCDVAGGEKGKALVQQIAALTKLNVAASTGPTGAAALGGDWALEYRIGEIHTSVLFSPAVEQRYGYLLGQTVETYDADVGFDTPGGESGTTSFTLDGLTYTTDQAVESVVDSFNENQFGPPPLTSSSAPNNGVLFMNLDATPLSSVTIRLSNGQGMKLQSFDIDVIAGTAIWIEPNGSPSNKVIEVTNGDGEETTFHIDVSSNANFAGITSFKIVDVGDSSGVFLPTIDNLTYTTGTPPVVTTTTGTTSYAGGTAATVVDSSVTVSDVDSTTLASGKVSISSGFHSGDSLAFTNTSATTYGNISSSYNSGTGVLTLTSSGATATVVQWQAAFDSTTFSSTSTTYSNRTISFVANDGTSDSAASTKTVSVINPSPVVTTDSGSASFVAADNASSTPVTIDSGLTVADVGSITLQSATVSITGNFHSGQDVLGFTNNPATMGNIIGSYSSGTGILTLTSSGGTTLAHWQAALDTVTYISNVITPNNATRTISFVVNDGSNTSNTATRTVTVTDTDQTPIVTTTGGTTGYVGGASATAIDGGVSVSDLDNASLASATVSIGAGFHSGDTLAFNNSSGTIFGNISASYNSGTGVLTLTSSGATATDTQWANALDAVTFSAASSVTPGSRTISFVVNDGSENAVAGTKTVNVAAPPIVTTDSGSAAFVAADNASSTPVVIDSGLTLTDASSVTLQSATVSITGNFHSGQDVLGFTNNPATMGNIIGSYNSSTGVLTLTSSGGTTLAHWQVALDAVTYIANVITPNNATRTVSFSVNDGSSPSNTATRTVTVTDTDQTPIVTAAGGTTAFIHNGGAVIIDGSITLSDRDNSSLASALVSISGHFHSGEDVLNFTNDGSTMGDIGASYNASTGVLTMTSSTATLAEWQKALASVTYNDIATVPDTTTRTITFAVNDGTVNSAGATQSVSISLQLTPIIAWATPSAITYGTALSATQLNATATVSGVPVTGTFSYTPSSGTILSSGANQTLSVSFTPADPLHYTTAGSSTAIFVNQATPIITWSAPSAIIFGTALSSTQLNAAASFHGSPVAGTFVYTPTSGTVLNGGTQNLGLVFAPNDTTDFVGAAGSVNLNVNRAGQTLAFPAVSSVKVGTPVSLSATASSGLATSFILVSGNATLIGNSLVIGDGNSVVVRASQPGNTDFLGATLDQTITAKLIQTITFPAVAQHKVTDQAFYLSATASSGLTVTYSILSGPATVSGSTATLAGTPGIVVVQASQGGDATYSAADPVRQSFNVISTNSWVFFGSLLDPNNSSSRLPNGQKKALALTPLSTNQNGFAATLAPDGTSGVLIGAISSLDQGFVLALSPDQSGHFSGTTVTMGGEGSPVTLTIVGTATSAGISGTVQPLGLNFQATSDSLVGPTSNISGYYTGSNLNNASGSTYFVVGSQGDVYALAIGSSGVTAGDGAVDATDHTFSVQATPSTTMTGAFDLTKGTAQGAITSGDETTRFSAVSSAIAASNVLVNMSNRGMVTPKSPLILGFVVAGTTDKTVVVRGLGPSLASFGIGNPLAKPLLTLYSASGAVLGSNAGWGGTTALTSAFAQVGAFSLSSTSADAALEIVLPPGAYTAVISDGLNDQGGTALGEIYDASIDPSELTQRLVNGSARGFVATGSPLIQGFVVSGNSPKKVLIRAVGPGLSFFGIAGALADPIVTVYDGSGNVVAWNDDWDVPLTAVPGQSVASAAEIAAAASDTGAFSLSSGSKDSAVIINLAPGAYTAVVSSPDTTTGTVLIEVYEF